MYRIYPAKIVPLLCGVAAIVMAILWSPWAILALPFIYLGSICAAPNMNLADGFLILVSISLGAGIAFLKREAGIVIIAGSAASWILSCFEKAMTAEEIKNEK